MTRLIPILLGVVCIVGVANADGAPPGPTPFSPRTGQPRDLPGSRDVVWSQPPDLNGFKVSSEIIGEFGLESKLADDFELEIPTTITKVTFWGGYYSWNGEDPSLLFNIIFYSDRACEPDGVLLQYEHVRVARTFVGYDGFGYPTYRYDAYVSFAAAANTVYWCMVQADDHVFPPQWGRQQASILLACGAMFNSGWWGWTPVRDLVGAPWDASFELDDAIDVPTACCLPDGTCEVLLPGDCMQAGGEPQAPGTPCTSGLCPFPAACCLGDGSCLFVTEEACLGQAGVPEGPGSDCEPNPCPPPEACCRADGTCTFVSADVCAAQAGEPLGPGVPCSPNPCPNQRQACCFGAGNCAMEQPAECIERGGDPKGPGSDCYPNPCHLSQACCFPDGSCSFLTAGDCLAQGGEPLGLGTDCNPDPCPPLQACCFALGTCRLLTAEACTAAMGLPQGAGALCDPSPCSPPATSRACCLGDDSCQNLPADDCIESGGTPLLPGTDCDPSPCIPSEIPHACCHADGSCVILPQNVCAQGGGLPQGACTICDPNPCPQPRGACCFPDGSCTMETVEQCQVRGGSWTGGACNPNPCQGTPVEPITWGRLKALFR